MTSQTSAALGRAALPFLPTPMGLDTSWGTGLTGDTKRTTFRSLPSYKELTSISSSSNKRTALHHSLTIQDNWSVGPARHEEPSSADESFIATLVVWRCQCLQYSLTWSGAGRVRTPLAPVSEAAGASEWLCMLAASAGDALPTDSSSWSAARRGSLPAAASS